MTIRSEFQVHLLNEQGITKVRELAIEFTALLNTLEDLCGKEGREMSLVRTHMEIASYYAKRAVASRSENQKTE